MERKRDRPNNERRQFQNSIESYREIVELAENLKDKTKLWEANLNLGQAYSSNNQIQLAVDSFQKAVEIAMEQKNKDQMTTAYLALGQAHKTNNEMDGAIHCFEKVLENAGKHDASDAHLALGDIFSFKYKIRIAIQHYTRALEIAKENNDTQGEMRSCFGLAGVYKLNNQFQMAIKYYKIALDIAGNRENKLPETMAFCWLGDAYRLNNQIYTAIQMYEKGLEIAKKYGYKPEETDIYIGLGLVNRQIDQIPTAIQYYKTALKIAEHIKDKFGETRATCGLGDCYRLNNRIDEAIQNYGKALTIAKERGYKQEETDIYIGLGHVNKHNHEFPQAIQYYKEALKIAKEREDKQGEVRTYCGLGNVYVLKKEIQNAIENYKKAKNIAKKLGYKREEQKACSGLAAAYELNNRFPQAIKEYKKALEISEEQGYKLEETDVDIGLGHVYVEISEIETAVQYYKKALQIATERHDENGKKRATYYLRAATEKREHKTRKPMEEVSKEPCKITENLDKSEDTIAGAISPAEDLLLVGRSYHEMEGKDEEAIKTYEQAIRAADEEGQNDVKVTAFQHLGKVFTDTSEYEKAIENYEKARELSPGLKVDKMEVIPYEWLGYNHLQAGKYQNSIECYKKVVALGLQLGENKKVIKANIGLGLAFNYIGQVDSSEKHFKNALIAAKQLKHGRLEREVLTHLAQLYYNHRKFDAAGKSYLKIEEISHELGEKTEETNACLMLGSTYQQLKQHELAIGYYQKAIDLSKKLDDKRVHGRAVQKLGTLFLTSVPVCNNDSDYKKAIEWYEKASDIFETEPIDYLNNEKALTGLGVACFLIGDAEKAILSLQKAQRFATTETDRAYPTKGLNVTDAEENLGEPNATMSKVLLEDEWADAFMEKARDLSRTERLHFEDLVRVEKYIKDMSSYVYSREISVKEHFTEKVRKAMTEEVKISAPTNSLLGKNVYKRDAKDAKLDNSDQEIFNFAKDEVSKNSSTKRPARLNETFACYMRSIGNIECRGFKCGTCFLVTDTLVITNYHVYRLVQEIRRESENSNLPIIICFDYMDRGKPEKVVKVEVDEQENPCNLENPYMDYKFFRVRQSEKLSDRVPLGPMVRNWQLEDGRVVILGHPGGDEMQDEVCIVVGFRAMYERIRDRHKRLTGVHMTNERLLHKMENHRDLLSYDSTFFSGASGSPVFDMNGNIVAMHTQAYTLETNVQLENVHANQELENVPNRGKKYSLMEFAVQFFSICRDIRRWHGETKVKELFPNYRLGRRN